MENEKNVVIRKISVTRVPLKNEDDNVNCYLTATHNSKT